MIPGLPVASHRPSWQRALADAITDPGELLTLLGLDRQAAAGARAAHREFRLKVPRGYVARMRRGDPADPLLLQVLPLARECEPAEGFFEDPVGDLDAYAGGGVLHKYRGRALVITTGACAVHCRYCFRRSFPYHEAGATPGDWAPVVERLRELPDLEEVILSGGDPLVLDDARLGGLVDALETLPGLRRLRLHTRLPIVLPERVTPALLRRLTTGRLAPVMVVHANHPNELDAAVLETLLSLAEAGITTLNQAVLLRGVNDSVDALRRLSERLFEARVLPYYLHVLDRARGTAHFEVPETEAVRLMQALRAELPGYLVPRLVREEAGAEAKTPLL
jgi:EF-P beta-lysylation protein EpmB